MAKKALCFLAGVLSVQQLPMLPDNLSLLAAACAALVLAFFRYWRGALSITGFLWAVLVANDHLEQRLVEHLAGQDIAIEGVITDLPESDSDHTRLNFSVTQSTKAIPNKLRLTWYHPPETALKAGQQWRLTTRLKPPHGNFNPGGFDYERWLLVEGIGATGYIRDQPQPLLIKGAQTGFSLNAWRQQLTEKLDNLLANCPNLPLIKALTLGDDSGLTDTQWEVFRQTGTTHLMVISGSHIGLIAALVYWIIGKLWLRTGIRVCSPQSAAALAALLAAALYAGLTGFSVPAQRAAFMVAIAMIAINQQRHTRPFHILALALWAVLLLDPLVVLLPGFWLSFIAVSLIIYTLAGRLHTPGFVRGSIKINWMASLGLTPLTLFFFQQISLIAPIANLLATPLISLAVVPMALMATLILFISPLLAAKLFLLVDWILQGLWWLLVQLADLPLSTVSHPQPSIWTFLFAVPAILLLLAPKGIPGRWLGVILLFPLIFSEPEKPGPGTFQLTLLDVGQGLSAVVRTANHVLVYDTGAKFSATSDSGQSVIIPYLRSQGIDNINTLIISHGDNDHIGGAESLLKTIKAGQVISSAPSLLSHYSPIACTANQSWQWDDVRFTMLSPGPAKFPSDNNNSCVLHIQSPQGSALLPGDIEADAEKWLTAAYRDQLKANLLIAPHHGSQTSSSANFLNAVKPETILIPAGYRNQFGHPHNDVLARYRSLRINWLKSADDGAIIADIQQRPNLETWRKKAGKYWNYKTH